VKKPHDLADNRIVALLPDQEREAVLAHSEIVSLEFCEVVALPDARTRDIYFSIDAVWSGMVHLAEGGLIEVGTIGNEGIVGIDTSVILSRAQASEGIYPAVGSARIEQQADGPPNARGSPLRAL
jgi:hypothetical protein